jgi:hypothetical protein
MTATTSQAHDLARAFATVLREWLTADEMAQVIEGNKTAPEGVCCSHDFCDANMAMDEAFTRVTGRTYPLGEEGPQQKADNALWNEAWDIAIATEFATGE